MAILIPFPPSKQASASPAPDAAAQWTKHTSPDGRPYWSKNGQSVWEKPDELKSPIEREMGLTGWKEYETGGRKYWVKGSETTWNMPQELTGAFSSLHFLVVFLAHSPFSLLLADIIARHK